MAKLTNQRFEEFAVAYVDFGSASKAYRRCYSTDGMKESTIYNRAYELKIKPEITARIRELRDQRAKELLMETTDALREVVAIIRADPSELVQHRICNCRNCYGVAFKWQWHSSQEHAIALAAQLKKNAAHEAKGEPSEDLPDDGGGFGFDPWRSPNPRCPVCLGMGHSRIWMADTRLLSGSAAKLFAGIQVTREGTKVLMRDQDGALDKFFRAMGMYKDGLQLNLGDGASVTINQEVPKDPRDATAFYQDLMKEGEAKK